MIPILWSWNMLQVSTLNMRIKAPSDHAEWAIPFKMCCINWTMLHSAYLPLQQRAGWYQYYEVEICSKWVLILYDTLESKRSLLTRWASQTFENVLHKLNYAAYLPRQPRVGCYQYYEVEICSKWVLIHENQSALFDPAELVNPLKICCINWTMLHTYHNNKE